MLLACELKYYFNYYKANNKDGSEDSKKAFRLKSLKTVDLLNGEIFHNQVKSLIKSSNVNEIGPNTLRTMMTNKIEKAFQDSQTKLKEWILNPKAYNMLNEVYYCQDNFVDKKKENSIRKLTECSKNIFNSLIFRELTGEYRKVKILELDSLSEFNDLTMKAYVKLDVLHINEEGMYVITDWKTSKNWCDTDVFQLLVYALYVHLTYGIAPERIRANLVYVAIKRSYTYTFTKEDLKFTKEKILSEMDRIKSCAMDTKTNQPLPENCFRAGNINVCKTCNYKEICG